jgi:hypothetical protein
MFRKISNTIRAFSRKHPIISCFSLNALGGGLIWSAGYMEALHDIWWVTAGGVAAIYVGLELIVWSASFLDEAGY